MSECFFCSAFNVLGVIFAYTDFGTVRCTSCLYSRCPIAPLVTGRGNNILFNDYCIADGAVFALGKSRFGACCGNSRVDHFGVSLCGNDIDIDMCCVIFTYTLFASLAETCCGCDLCPLAPVMTEMRKNGSILCYFICTRFVGEIFSAACAVYIIDIAVGRAVSRFCSMNLFCVTESITFAFGGDVTARALHHKLSGFGTCCGDIGYGYGKVVTERCRAVAFVLSFAAAFAGARKGVVACVGACRGMVNGIAP